MEEPIIMETIDKYNIVFLGLGNTGKSTLSIQFLCGYYETNFDHYYYSEISCQKEVNVDNRTSILNIIDNPDQHEHYDKEKIPNIEKGHGFLIVYDITSRNSFDECDKYIDTVLRIKKSTNVPMILVGAKKDLEENEERQVSYKEGKEKAESYGIPFIETSAKLRINVNETFFEIVRIIRKHDYMSNEPLKKDKKKIGECQIL